MEFENLYISCESMDQRSTVINTALANGYERFCDDHNEVGVFTTECGKVFDLNWSDSFNRDEYKNTTYGDFMSKYGKQQIESDLQIKINEAKEKLKLSNNQLSYALGKSKPYITKMLNYPQTEKVSKKVIAEIDSLLEGNNVESFVKKIKAKNKLIVELQHSVRMLNGEVEQIKYEHGKKVTELKKQVEDKQTVIWKLDDQLLKAEKVHNEDLAAIKRLTKSYQDANEIILDNESTIIDLINEKSELNKLLEKERFSVGRLGGELNDANRCRDYWIKQSDYLEEELVDANKVIKRDRIIAIVVFAIILLIVGVLWNGRVL